MKKAIRSIVIAAAAASVLIFSGCSAVMPFNPTGKWVLTDDVLYTNGEETEHLTRDDLAYSETAYVFDKNGTGYISVNGTRIMNFDYEYDEKGVSLAIDSTPVNPKAKINAKNEITHVRFELISDNDILGAQMARTSENDFKDEEGHDIHLKEQFFITKSL